MKIDSVIFISLKVEELSSSPTIVVFFLRKTPFKWNRLIQKNSNKKLNTVVSIPLQCTGYDTSVFKNGANTLYILLPPFLNI